jgi:beta-lactamase regulating signal transducer with metallopeptidase domain
MNTWIEQLNPIATQWLEALWRASWQGGLAFILVWLFCTIFKKAPARAKSWLWRLAYLKLLVAFFWATPIDLPLLPAKAWPPLILATGTAPANAVASPQPPPLHRPAATVSSEVTGHTAAALPAAHPAQTASVAPPRIHPAPATWLLLLWLAGIVGFGICLWRKLRHVRRVQRTCKPVADPVLLQCGSELAQSFRLRSAPTLLVSDAAASPLLMRILRPVIVLPSTLASAASPHHLRLMLAHEMAHLRRFDLWWAWLAVAGEGLFFFHPLLWLARRGWRLSQEMACDELAMRMTRAPVSAYGDMLVGAAALTLADPPNPLLVTIGLTESKQMLVKRLNAMKLLNLNPTKSTFLATTAVLAAGLLSLLPWRLTAQPSSEPPPVGETTFSRGRVGGSGMSGISRGMSALSPTTPPTNVAPARFEATVYEIAVPENRIADLDAVKLESAASTPQSLAKALEPFGAAKILYKVDQIVNLYGETITVGTQEPMVTGTSMRAGGGGPVNSISYTSVGLITRISATPGAAAKSKEPEVQLNFQLSSLTSSDVEMATGVPVQRVHNVALSQSGTPKFGKPTVLVTVSAAGASEKTPPIAYIVRYQFTQQKP